MNLIQLRLQGVDGYTCRRKHNDKEDSHIKLVTGRKQSNRGRKVGKSYFKIGSNARNCNNVDIRIQHLFSNTLEQETLGQRTGYKSEATLGAAIKLNQTTLAIAVTLGQPPASSVPPTKRRTRNLTSS